MKKYSKPLIKYEIILSQNNLLEGSTPKEGGNTSGGFGAPGRMVNW